MRTFTGILFLALALFAVNAQERQFTDKILGGSSNGIVGSIDADLDVTPTGQLSYSIPLPSLPGTGGIAPKLSICYNSATKDGLLGYGFDLKGLSIINRAPSNIFLDKQISTVNFTATDRFSIDGMRLVARRPSGGNFEYSTENDNYSKIVAIGNYYNPTSFIVNTKSGLTYEYSSNLSVIGGNTDNTLFWLVTKVSDTLGNYYTVSYGGDSSTNDFWVTRIDYTGNDAAGLTPYASVRFSYQTNPYTPVSYIHGQKVRRGRIISSIEMWHGSTRQRTYAMSYNVVNRKYQLASITEKAADGTIKNPTKFTWSNVDSFKVSNINYTQTSSIHKAILTVGDFNGDGMADFIATPENANAGWKGWKIFLSNGNGFDYPVTGSWSWPNEEIQQVICADFNGDGLDDVVVKRKTSGGWHNGDLYLSSKNASGSGVTLKFSNCFVSRKQDHTFRAVELNGDGVCDIFLWESGSKKYTFCCSDTLSGNVKPLVAKEERSSDFNWDRVEFGDFNGDGLTEILNFSKDGYKLIQEKAWRIDNVASGTWPSKDHVMEFGDFNGDGKTDILLTGLSTLANNGSWPEWCIMYSKGDNTFEKIYKAKPFDAKDKKLFIADVNGDGFDEFQAVDNVSSGSAMTRPLVYLNDGSGDFFKPVTGETMYALDKWHLYTGDFNGDGKIDFVCTSDWNKSNWDGYQLYLMPSDPHSLLTGITDGLGNTSTVKYSYMSDKTACTNSASFSYPLISRIQPWPVVKSVQMPDGVGGVATQTYKYTDPVMHANGLGFLCFSTFAKTDGRTRIVTTHNYEIHPSRYAVGLKKISTAYGTVLLSQTDRTNTLREPEVNSYSFLPTEERTRNYEYTSRALISDVTTKTEYDSYGNPTKITVSGDSVTSVTVNTYSNNTGSWILGRLLTSSVTMTNAAGSISRKSAFSYDAASGLLVSESFEPGNAKLGYTKTYTRDSYGNITQSTVSPNDKSVPRSTLSTYDGKGRFIVSATDALGFTTTNIVNESTGNLTKSTDPNGEATTYTYDSFGRLIQSVHPLSKTVSTTGWSTGMTDAPVNAVYFVHSQQTASPYSIVFYDCLGRQLRTVTEALDGKKIYVDYVYNSKGQLYKQSEPYFSTSSAYWTTFSYDTVGRLSGQTDPDGKSTAVRYNGLTTEYTDVLGHKSTKVMDAKGNLVKSTDADGAMVSYSYDAQGNCVEVSGPRTLITMEYDIAGNRILLDDPDLGTVSESYNAFGELTTRTDAYGTVSYVYDKGGRVVTETRDDITVKTKYDSAWKGNADEVKVTGATDATTTFSYDSHGRPIKEILLVGTDAFTTQTSYNTDGLVDVVTYPSGLKIKNGYSSCGFLTSVSDNTSGKKYWELTALDARGQIEKEKFGNNLVSTLSHDQKKGYLTGISTPGIQNWTYSYDAAGNLTERKDVARNLTEKFVYDNVDRLVSVSKNGVVTQTMSYDKAGNIVSKSDVGDYSYEEGTNWLASITGCVRQPMIWDEIKYSSFGKISRVKSGSRVMELSYGAGGKRIKQKIGNRTRIYIGTLAERVTEENGAIVNVSYVFGGGHLVAVVEENKTKGQTVTRYAHHDHLGSIQAFSNADGSLHQELSYDAWGRRRNPADWIAYAAVSGASAWRQKGFGGHEHVDEFEMIDMGGRMYDPVVGRFISPDPVVQMPDFSQSLNRYSYCVNNPLTLIDPSGYSWFSKHWKSIVGSIVGIAVGAVTLGSGTAVGAVIIAGAAGGAAGALTGALLNGSNLAQIAKATFTGGLVGAASGFLNFASADSDFILSLVKHTFSQGYLEGIQGGNMLHGFMMGAVSKAGGAALDAGTDRMGWAGKMAANSIFAGTVDELGGGKFANGAITGAFTYLFNEKVHRVQDKGDSDEPDPWIAAGTLALTLSAADGPLPIGDIIGSVVLAGTAVYDLTSRVYLTYILHHPDGRVYVGRTSGFGSPFQVMMKRYYGHERRKEGFRNPELDRFAHGAVGGRAIRGREQQLIDYFGGIGNPKVANIIRGVAKYNIMGRIYHYESNIYFGNIAPYTGY